MPELFPVVTLDVSDMLVVQTDFELIDSRPDKSWIRTLAERSLEIASKTPGVSVTQDQARATTHIDINRFLDPDASIIEQDAASKAVLSLIDPLVTPHHILDDERDGVVEFTDLTFGHGIRIHRHFQGWLNAGGVDREVAERCMEVMAIPFGRNALDDVRENTHIDVSGNVLTTGARLFAGRLSCQPANVGLVSDSKRGTGRWSLLTLQTSGDCACLGPDGSNMNNIRIKPNTPGLYDLVDHNIDRSTAWLSLVLGLAALADEAAAFEAEQDIFADVTWRAN